MLGTSSVMQEMFALVQKIAPCDVNVLITGETGTGKELLARAIHQLSGRSSRPLVAFSCVNLPETLVEDEFFGHEKGAFTGALMARRGRLETADQGTLFLDEIGDLGLGLQPKLLRVLQERSFERLGSSTPVNLNIRLICATNRNLAEMVQKGTFREDLYYRLNVVHMHLPPLRDRREDIPSAGPALPAGFRRAIWQEGQEIFAGCRADSRRVRLAGQRPRARKRHSAGRGAIGRPDSRCVALAAFDHGEL